MELLSIEKIDNKRYYKFRDGTSKISVTSLFSDLNRHFKSSPDTFFTDRGNFWHKEIEKGLQGGGIQTTFILNYLPNFKKPIAVEKLVISDAYAGTLDLVYLDNYDNLVLVDFKTVSLPRLKSGKLASIPKATIKKYSLQLLAYKLAYPQPITKTLLVFLTFERGNKENNLEDVRVVEADTDNPELLQEFLGYLAASDPNFTF